MALASILVNSLDKVMGEYAKTMKTIAQEEVHVKSGALRESISDEKKEIGHYRVGVDSARLKTDPRNAGGIDYSVFYHGGHKAYTIRARNAKALRWIGSDGKVHFAKSVRIPASAGDPFIERAVARRPRI